MGIFNIKKIFNKTNAQDLSSNLSTTPTNPQQGLIAACGVMTTPALMINNTIISTGKVLTVAELQALLPQYLSN